MGTLPDLALKPKPSLTEIIDDFEKQLGGDRLRALVCNIMQYSANSFIVHLGKAEQVPEFVAAGINFRGHPVKLVAAKATTTVILEKVPYGLNAQVIAAELRPYGVVKGSKSSKYKGLSISKIVLEMEIKTSIPSRIFIQGNPINVFYRNQPRSCFSCGQSGHEAKSCPKRTLRPGQRASASSLANGPARAPVSRGVSDNRKRPRAAVSDDDDEPSFSDIVSGNRSTSPPPPPAPSPPLLPPPLPVIPPNASATGDSLAEPPIRSPSVESSQVESASEAAPVTSEVPESQVEIDAPVDDPADSVDQMDVSSGLALLNRLLEEPPKELIPRPPLAIGSESESQSLDVSATAASDPPNLPLDDVSPAQEGDGVVSQLADSMDQSSGMALVSRVMESPPKTLLPRPTPPSSPRSQPVSSAPSSTPSKNTSKTKDLFVTPERTLSKITRVRQTRNRAKAPVDASLPTRKSTRPSPVPTTRRVTEESPNRFSILTDEGDTS